ncbi:MAG: branched-chain amino acid ABC transporter ATP-binding protein/permease, partial [Propionibacteriaceae bacterium]|nr:branched-chain amino acid ABC transporter ATP-binding protein/permease [Propionibacteriaceae bacterium]
MTSDRLPSPRPPWRPPAAAARRRRLSPNGGRVWLGVALAVAVYALPVASASPYLIQIMTTALIYVMLAMGLNVVVGFAGLLDLGYIAFFAVGAYTSGILTTRLGWPMWAAIPAVVLGCVVAGIVIGGPTLRLRSDYLAIVTLGFGEIIRLTANNLTSLTGGPSGIFGIPTWRFGDWSLADGLNLFGLRLERRVLFYYFVATIVFLVGVIGLSRLAQGKLGRAWRAVRDDEDAAEAMGVNTYAAKITAYVIGAVWAGLAGQLMASHISTVSPTQFQFLYSALVLCAVVIGGLGSMPGAIVGALLISLLPEALRDVWENRYLLFGLLLLAVMLFRPQGLWPATAALPWSRDKHLAASPDADQLAREGRRGGWTAVEGEAGTTVTEPTAASETTTGAPTAATTPGDESAEPLLVVEDLRLAFGGVVAVDGLSLTVRPGEIVSVIGPNGAGKTSAFNCISGFYRPDRGAICFRGRRIDRLRPCDITRLGLARTFQNLRLFDQLTILDNVKTAAHGLVRQGWYDACLRTPRYRRGEREIERRAQGWLDFVGFRGDDSLYASQLSYGQQRQVEIARALNASPALLLLDEPAAGLNHNEKQALIELIGRIRDLGVAIVLIEHDMGLVMRVSQRVVVLNHGKEIAVGPPDQIRDDPLVIEAYLGSDEAEEQAEAIMAQEAPEALSLSQQALAHHDAQAHPDDPDHHAAPDHH